MGFDETAENRVEADDREIVAADNAGLHFARFAQAHHRKPDLRKISKFGNCLNAGLQVLDFGDGEMFIIHADAAGALLNVDEPVFIRIDERPK